MLEKRVSRRSVLLDKLLRETNHRSLKSGHLFPELHLPWTDTDDRGGFDGISLEIIKVLTLAFEQIQFEIFMSMDRKPVWSLCDRFFNCADKNAGIPYRRNNQRSDKQGFCAASLTSQLTKHLLGKRSRRLGVCRFRRQTAFLLR
jgi:hypothetical protein